MSEEIAFEALKVGLRQSKDGINITLVIHPDDVHPELLADPIGARYAVKLVRIGDDEQPVQRKSELNTAVRAYPPSRWEGVEPLAPPAPAVAESASALRKAKLNIIASAGILCRDRAFQAWLFKRGNSTEPSEAGAVEGLHAYLKIHSRAQLADSARARSAFITLRGEFERDLQDIQATKGQ